jgi:hypothetical protein
MTAAAWLLTSMACGMRLSPVQAAKTRRREIGQTSR